MTKLLWTIGLAILISTANLVHAEKPLDRMEQIDLFREANNFFHQANTLIDKDPKTAGELYRQSAMRYLRIVRQGKVQNGKLYYNIANAYFRSGDIGLAILYYRLAEKFIPDNPDLRQNLAYAQTRCLDKIPETQQTRVLKTLFFWHYDFSEKTKAVLFYIFFIILCLSASIRIFVRKGPFKKLIVLSACLSFLTFGSLLIQAVTDSQNISGVILNPEVIARKGDAVTYQPSFKEPLHAGTEFQLLEDRGDWYHIELSDSRSCWVPAKSAGLVKNM